MSDEAFREFDQRSERYAATIGKICVQRSMVTHAMPHYDGTMLVLSPLYTVYVVQPYEAVRDWLMGPGRQVVGVLRNGDRIVA